MKDLPLALALLLAGCAGTSAAPAPAPAPPAPAEPSPPAEPPPGLEEARADRLLAKEAADAGDGTTAQLHLLDARTAVDRLLAASPADPEVLREAGRIERDSFRFAEGAARFRAALERSPARDGETVYDLAYCLAYGGDFAAALPLFLEAESLLGPQARIEVNAAICEERTGDRGAGVARLARLYRLERAAGRDGKAALEKTWDLTVQKRDFESGIAAFRALGEAHPDRPEPFFMLGNLLAFLSRHGEAAEAYAKSLSAAPTPAALARRARELALAGAGMRVPADAAVREALSGAAGHPETADAALRTVRLHLTAGEPGAARDLAAAAGRALEGNAALAIAEGDACLAGGNASDAADAYAMARGLDPFSTEAEAREARAELALARSDPKGDSTVPEARAVPLDPVPPKEILLDFEDSALLVRPLSGVRFVEGAARFPAPAPGSARRVALHFFPDLSALRWSHLDVRLRSEGPPSPLKVLLADGYDQMADQPPGYLAWPEAPEAGPEWTTVSVPLRAFRPDTAVRVTGTDLARIKCCLLEYASALRIDSVALRDEASGAVRVLQAFDGPPEETTVLFDGTTAPFTRVIASPAAAADLLPTGTGPVSRAIVEDQNGTFDPSMVGRGGGALRLRHGETGFFPSKQSLLEKPVPAFADGPGAGVVQLNPDRDLRRFRSLTFLARGEKGGEKVRVRLLDAHSLLLEPTVPAGRWPRSIFPRTAREDGAIALGPEWRMYRVPLESFPEVDRAALAEIRFEVGSEVANAPGATIYLDEIGLEY